MDSKLTDSAFPMQIGDVEYLASVLTDRDYGDLDQYMKSVFIKRASDAADLIPDEEKERKQFLISTALKESANVGWGIVGSEGLITSPEGMMHIGYQMIKKRHPTVTYNAFKKEAYKNLTESIKNINLTDRHLNYVEVEKGSGGTPTENDKSN